MIEVRYAEIEDRIIRHSVGFGTARGAGNSGSSSSHCPGASVQRCTSKSSAGAGSGVLKDKIERQHARDPIDGRRPVA